MTEKKRQREDYQEAAPGGSGEEDEIDYEDGSALWLLRQRRILYPDIYKSEESVLTALVSTAVESSPADMFRHAALNENSREDSTTNSGAADTTASETISSSKKKDVLSSLFPKKDFMQLQTSRTAAQPDENHSAEAEAPAIQTRNSAYTQADVWGRIPTKEPKYLIQCRVCSRMINSQRFAPHLDKCMGIGTTNRAAAAVPTNGGTAGGAATTTNAAPASSSSTSNATALASLYGSSARNGGAAQR